MQLIHLSIRRISLQLLLLISVLGGYSSCSLDLPVDNERTDPKAIYSLLSAHEALSSAYSELPTEHLSLSILSDDFIPNTTIRDAVNLYNLYRYEPLELKQWGKQVWAAYYSTIRDINALTEREQALRSSLNTQEQLQLNYLLGEAYTLKAFCYLQLMRLFATPWSDTQHTEGIILRNRTQESNEPRATKTATRQEIQRLLSEAIRLFQSVSQVNSLLHPIEPIFASEQATLALQAQLALETADYDTARSIAESYLEAYPIPLTSCPLEINQWSGTNVSAGILVTDLNQHLYASITADPNLGHSRDIFLINSNAISFSASDRRATIYTAPFVSSTLSNGLALGKYASSYVAGNRASQPYQIRKQELVFIKAEAEARLGNLTEATNTLNAYLKLIEATPIDESLSQTALVEQILNEKRKEFVGENVRFFDLKRCSLPIRRYGVGGTATLSTLEAKDYRWTLPIPESEFRYNPVQQNPGWSFD